MIFAYLVFAFYINNFAYYTSIYMGFNTAKFFKQVRDSPIPILSLSLIETFNL